MQLSFAAASCDATNINTVVVSPWGVARSASDDQKQLLCSASPWPRLSVWCVTMFPAISERMPTAWDGRRGQAQGAWRTP